MLGQFVLKGYIRGKGEQEQFFTANETDLALQVVRRWLAKGWKPFLVYKTYDGNFTVM